MRRLVYRSLAAALAIGCASEASGDRSGTGLVTPEPTVALLEAPAHVAPTPVDATSGSPARTSGDAVGAGGDAAVGSSRRSTPGTRDGASVGPSGPETSAARVAELGPDVQVLPFTPARYAGDVGRQVTATHALNWYREDTRASIVLEFAADGGVHGCRGRRSDSSNDGPTVHRATRTREQQGYRGTWAASSDGSIAVALGLDDGPCAQQRLYSDLAPSPWRLRCLLVRRGERAPLLACRLQDADRHKFDETHGLLVPDVLPQRWIVLGPGDGLRVEWRSRSVSSADDGTVTFGPAPRRVEPGTWSLP